MERKAEKSPPVPSGVGGEASPGDKAGNARPQGKGGPASAKKTEVGGPKGPDPTRFGDWERKGRCIDF